MEIPEIQHQVMGYDRSATMFSPEGHILQVEYAEKSVRWGTASIGVKCEDGVVIVADKGEKNSLVVPSSSDKIYKIDEHIMASAAGIISDARILIDHVRIIAQQHRVTYDTPIDVESIIKEISDIKQQYTQHPGVRPFGAAILVAGVDKNEGKVYTSDVTGNYFEYYAISIGKDDEKINELLKKRYKPNMKIEEGIKMALKIFKEILKEKFNVKRFSVGYVKIKEEKIKKLEEEEIKKYI